MHMEETPEGVLATVASHSLRYAFLRNDPLVCTFKFRFETGKISQIDVLECPDADWDQWQQRRDSLVKWVHDRHPELDGFIHDLTLEGALRYQKAIQLYTSGKDGG